jgi:hypothetical protein
MTTFPHYFQLINSLSFSLYSTIPVHGIPVPLLQGDDMSQAASRKSQETRLHVFQHPGDIGAQVNCNEQESESHADYQSKTQKLFRPAI